MKNRLYLYPKWLRLWHIFNALLCLLLIVTGISMQYASKGAIIFSFKTAVQIHDVCGILLSASYLLFISGNMLSDNQKHYKISKKGLLKGLKKQIKYYTLGIFRGEQNPFVVSEKIKFNPIQQLSYIAVMYFILPVVIVTGILMFFPEKIAYQLLGISGTLFVDVVHIIAGFVISWFLLIHIYFSTIGMKHNNNFKSIINGYHNQKK